MKEEGFFESVSEVNITTSKNSTTMQSASTDNDIGLIMSLSMSLLGFWINDLTPRLKKGLKWNETCHQHYFVSKNSVAVESFHWKLVAWPIQGVSLLIQGLLRDYLSFGLCRVVTYSSLCLSYLLFAIAEPGYSDHFQDFFIYRTCIIKVRVIVSKHFWPREKLIPEHPAGRAN